MNVIDFPGNSGGGGALVDRAVALKQRLLGFVLEGPMREDFERERALQGATAPGAAAFVDFADWFIFEWEGEDGTRVLDEFLASAPGLTEEDRQILEGWYDTIDDVFEIVARRGAAYVLRDQDGAEYTALPTAMSASDLGWPPGAFVSTRLAPVGDVYLFSGTQTLGATRDELREGEADEAEDMGVLWRVLAAAFEVHFGDTEVVLAAGELPDRIAAFYDFAFNEFVPPGFDRPLATLFQQEAGVSLPLEALRLEVPAEAAAQEVGLLADPEEGLAIVPGYGELKRYAATGEGDPDPLAGLALELLNEDDIPPFVFRRLAEAPGSRLGELLALALDDPEFDLERDLEDLLAEFKPDGGESLDVDGGELISPEDVLDVRAMALFEPPSGSVAEAACAYVRKLEETLKPAALERHVEGISLFAHYTLHEEISRLEDLDVSDLRHFLGVWYVRHWARRSAQDVGHLVTAVEKLTAWLDKARGTRLHKSFKRVVAELRPDLVRVMTAVDAVDRAQRARENAGGADFDGFDYAPDEVRVGEFAVVGGDGATLRVEERPGGSADGAQPVTEIDVPAEAAGLLRAGDVLEAELYREAGRWRVSDLIGVYPPSAFE
jgi:hypothetical protein